MASFTAGVIIGVPWSDVVKKGSKTVQVKKFDPDSGEPGMKDVVETVVSIGGMVVEDEIEFLEQNGFKELSRSAEDFSWWETGAENRRDKVIGRRLADHDVEYDGGCDFYDPAELQEHIEAVKAALTKIGCGELLPKVCFYSYSSA